MKTKYFILTCCNFLFFLYTEGFTQGNGNVIIPPFRPKYEQIQFTDPLKKILESVFPDVVFRNVINLAIKPSSCQIQAVYHDQEYYLMEKFNELLLDVNIIESRLQAIADESIIESFTRLNYFNWQSDYQKIKFANFRITQELYKLTPQDTNHAYRENLTYNYKVEFDLVMTNVVKGISLDHYQIYYCVRNKKIFSGTGVVKFGNGTTKIIKPWELSSGGFKPIYEIPKNEIENQTNPESEY